MRGLLVEGQGEVEEAEAEGGGQADHTEITPHRRHMRQNPSQTRPPPPVAPRQVGDRDFGQASVWEVSPLPRHLETVANSKVSTLHRKRDSSAIKA